MIRDYRQITKEQYERALDHGGYLTDEDLEEVFAQSMLCGYGVYSPIAYKEEDVSTKETKYGVMFYTSLCCD